MKETPCTLAHAIERAQSYPDGHWCRVLLAEVQRLQRLTTSLENQVLQQSRPPSCIQETDTYRRAVQQAADDPAVQRAIADLPRPEQLLAPPLTSVARGKRPPLHRPKGWIYPQDRAPWWRRMWAWFRKELRRPQAFPLNDPRAHP